VRLYHRRQLGERGAHDRHHPTQGLPLRQCVGEAPTQENCMKRVILRHHARNCERRQLPERVPGRGNDIRDHSGLDQARETREAGTKNRRMNIVGAVIQSRKRVAADQFLRPLK
jgi:hypothetical protein